jgi:hypothetical protein
MKSLNMADYYVWFCDWCDSRNLTPWTGASTGKVCCGGCHKEYPVTGALRESDGRLTAASL